MQLIFIETHTPIELRVRYFVVSFLKRLKQTNKSPKFEDISKRPAEPPLDAHKHNLKYYAAFEEWTTPERTNEISLSDNPKK
jgi:hypothetical protein